MPTLKRCQCAQSLRVPHALKRTCHREPPSLCHCEPPFPCHYELPLSLVIASEARQSRRRRVRRPGTGSPRRYAPCNDKLGTREARSSRTQHSLRWAHVVRRISQQPRSHRQPVSRPRINRNRATSRLPIVASRMRAYLESRLNQKVPSSHPPGMVPSASVASVAPATV